MAKVTLFVLGILTVLVSAAAQRSDQTAGTPPAPTAVSRGQYIVHHVAMCVQCHTPRNERGALEYTRLLQGASVAVKSPFANQEWGFQAPRIAGLPGWTREDAVFLLQSGYRSRDGRAPRPPMPSYRMSREDAEAVVAYLLSLR